jgi:hypothetical protein
MGIGLSRRSQRAPQVVAANSNCYKYPPKTDNYFSTHFIMGGERFESAKPDAYLFGENEDLNFLGSKPTPFPYPVPQPHEPTKTLRSLVNIRRDSVRLVKDLDETNQPSTNMRYNIEFTFDTDVKCAITIYYFAKEEIANKQAIYHPRDPEMNSDTFHYKRGANQTFSQPTHLLDPNQFSEDEWKYSPETDVIPVVIQCVVEEADQVGHSHMTFAVIEKSLDGGFSLKPLKQKQMVDGLCYLLQEIYGIENKNAQRTRQPQDDDIEDNGSECVICMCETRDTLILPCRHLCLCNSCADNLRYQANNCPICRAKFHALLQIKAMRKRTATSPTTPTTAQNETTDESSAVSQEGIPAGYEAVSLIEALNGPTQAHCACSVATVATEGPAAQTPTDAATDGLTSEESVQTPSNEAATTIDETSDEKAVLGDQVTDDKDDDDSTLSPHSPIVDSPSKEAFERGQDTSIPMISDDDDDEDSDDPTDAYATPLHETRVTLRNPPIISSAPSEHGGDSNNASDHPPSCSTMEEGRLQITTTTTTGSSIDDSRYSSSSSTKDLLEHGPEDATSVDCGILGCSGDIDISIV